MGELAVRRERRGHHGLAVAPRMIGGGGGTKVDPREVEHPCNGTSELEQTSWIASDFWLNPLKVNFCW